MIHADVLVSHKSVNGMQSLQLSSDFDLKHVLHLLLMGVACWLLANLRRFYANPVP